MRKKIYYKNIFDYGDSKDSVNYIEMGSHEIKDDLHIIRFQTQEGLMDIRYNEREVHLNINQSHLMFCLEEELDNEYHTMQGSIILKTRCESIKITENTLQFIYELYQGEMLVAHNYLYIRMQEAGVDA